MKLVGFADDTYLHLCDIEDIIKLHPYVYERVDMLRSNLTSKRKVASLCKAFNAAFIEAEPSNFNHVDFVKCYKFTQHFASCELILRNLN